MQQAFQKSNVHGQILNYQGMKQPSQVNILKSQPYMNQRVQIGKNETHTFATVTANTGSMIVSNQPLSTKIDPTKIQGSSHGGKINRINNNKSNCFPEQQNAIGNSQNKAHSSASKYNQQNHHTLQCISDINEFKQKINMVLQTQAFPNKIGQSQNQMDSISNKHQLASNATVSINPTSRIGYSNGKHESPTPNMNKNSFFPKQKVSKQSTTNQVAMMNENFDQKNEQIVQQAFQSFKQNLKQQHQQFINQNGPNYKDYHQSHDSKSQGSVITDSVKLPSNQGGPSYLLRNQKDKDKMRNHGNIFQHPIHQSNDDMPNFSNDVHQKLLNSQYGMQQMSISLQKKGYLSNMIQNGSQEEITPTQSNSGNTQKNQRRKLLIEYGFEQATPENKQNHAVKKSPIDNKMRSSVFSQQLSTKLNKKDILENLEVLNIQLMEDKDRETLKSFAYQYLSDLKQFSETLIQEPPGNSLLSAAQSIHDDSAEKFKLNEKNLREERLRKGSKMELSLGVETRQAVKSTTPAMAGNNEEESEDIVSLQNDLKTEKILKKNVSQKQFTSNQVQEMGESESNPLFKTENNRNKGLFRDQEEIIDNQPLDQTNQKIQILSQLIEDLEKPKMQIPIGRSLNSISNRGLSNLHFSHSNYQQQDMIKIYQNSINDKKDHQGSDWMQGVAPIKIFLASLNCPKPTPQQVNVMNNSKQRLDLFKILQAREHVKFTSIQSEKMLQLQIRLEQELENKNLAIKNQINNDQQRKNDNNMKMATQNQKIIDQSSLKQQMQINQMNNMQQLKNMRKQQQNDQKAFSIFQMNELAQFRSMSDGQQKQILLNNLQQGKFDDFENLMDPIVIPSKPTGSLNQAQSSEAPSIHNSSKLSKGGVRSFENTNDSLKKGQLRNARQTIEDSNQKTEELSTNKTDTQRKSILGGQEAQSKDPNSIRMAKYFNNVKQSQDTTRSGADLLKESNYQQYIQNLDSSEHKLRQVMRESLIKQQKLKIFYQQMNDAFVNYVHNNRFYQQVHNAGLGIDHMFPHIQRAQVNSNQPEVEEKNKSATRARARQSQGNQIKDSSNCQSRPIDRSKSKSNFNAKEVKEPTNIQFEKKKEEIVKEIENKESDSKKEAEEGEEAVQEVKKPRYFPPKKLPNPFENAAQEQEKFIQARKEAFAKYSQISKNRFKQDEQAPHKYVIRPGNNSKLIQKVFEKSGRIEAKFDTEGNTIFPGWETADDFYNSLFNFKWKPTSQGIKFDLIGKHGLKQIVNHVKGHYHLTTKDNLFTNLKGFYESQKINIYDFVPFTIVIDYLKDDVGDRVETFSNVLKLVDKHIDQDIDTINQKLQEMQSQREKTIKSLYKFGRCMHDNQNLWLLKPTGFNRGIGIHIFQNFDQLKEIMCTYYGIGRGMKDKSSIFQTHKHTHAAREYVDQNGEKQFRNFSFVIQKLIERPLLYLNRKFDIRTWVLVTSHDGKVFQFKESYVRTSSKEYKEYDPLVAIEEQIYMQLTNNAVQKEGQDYGKFEEGNIISLDTLFNFVSQSPHSQQKSKKELKNKFLSESERFITDTFKSIKGKIAQQKYTFELFGYDFILDEDLNTYLIEINTNPCLEESNNLLRNMLPRMIDDLMNIAMDPLFYPTETAKYKSAFPLPGSIFQDENLSKNSLIDKDPHLGYRESENLFKHIYTMEQ